MDISWSAPAKLNRFLAVLGRRQDGFHDLELVTTVLEGLPGLTDTLKAEDSPSLHLDITGPEGRGLESGDSNLVLRAWRLLEQEAGRALPARLSLTKRIPCGAGLGGGSSDAAAALRLGNEFHGLGIPGARLLELAAGLGSDVPLFLLGGTVLGLGRGERVYPLRPIPLEPMLVLHPRLHVATGSVYGALAGVGYPPPRPLASLEEGAPPPWRNDLAEAALSVCPALASARDVLREAGGEPLLCGSGSCWVARFPSPGTRDSARKAIGFARPDWGLWAAG